jgi:hypothetical protein
MARIVDDLKTLKDLTKGFSAGFRIGGGDAAQRA